jgi:O-antigen/teichoic acid export membrane protein
MLSNQAAGWIDQILVSATNFLLLLALARWSGIADVGYFAIAASVIAFALAIQDSLATRPYTILLLKLTLDPKQRAMGTLNSSVLISAVCGAGGVVAGSSLYYVQGSPIGAQVAFVLGLAVPAALLREFARRHSFAHLRAWLAVAIDMASLLLASTCIVSLGLTGYISATSAIAALGLANLVAFGAWLGFRQQDFAGGAGKLMATLRENVALGKWFLVGQLAGQARGYATHWITFAIGGAASTGLYSGCLSIVSLSNPFLFGYFNTLTPQFVRVLREGGPQALRRQAMLATLLIAIVMTVFTWIILTFGTTIVQIVLPGDSFRDGAKVLAVLALANFAGAVGGPAGVALMVAEKGRILAYTSTWAFVLGSVIVWNLMVGWGLEVAAYGVLLIELVVSVARWVILAFSLNTTPATINQPSATATGA